MNALIQTKMGLFKLLLSLFCAISHQMACSSSVLFSIILFFFHTCKDGCALTLKTVQAGHIHMVGLASQRAINIARVLLKFANWGFNLCRCKNQSKLQPKI